MFSGLTLVTPPSAEPVSIADAKAHSRVSFSIDDPLIAAYISSARNTCESILRRALMPQTWQYTLKHWPGRDNTRGFYQTSTAGEYERYNHIKIPLPPLVSITSFTYTDTAGNVYNMTQGFDSAVGNYLLDVSPEPGRVNLPFAGIWPTTILLPGSPIQITYACGYSAFSGILNISTAGVATWVSGSNFDPSMSGSWVTVNNTSYTVDSVASGSSMQLIASGGTPVTPVENGNYTANAVPMPIRHAILLLVGHFYENRESVVVGRTSTIATEIPFTIDNLLAPYRIASF